jgi:hypothetical protein
MTRFTLNSFGNLVHGPFVIQKNGRRYDVTKVRPSFKAVGRVKNLRDAKLLVKNESEKYGNSR